MRAPTSLRTSLPSLAAFAFALATSSPARADDAPRSSSETDAPAPAPAVANHAPAWAVDVGLRQSFIAGSGYDPYATDNALQQFSLGASRTIFRAGALSFAPGLRWDAGGTSAVSRGADTSLFVHRVAVSLEGRFDVVPAFRLFVRVAPGVASTSIRVNDDSSANPLTANRWLFSGDVSVGGVVTIPAGRHFRLGLAPELGYGIVSKSATTLTPTQDDTGPRRTGTTSLPSLALSGAFFRVSAVAEF